jgi:HTH-type transcriptional regulator/antitoxin HipB
VQGNQDEWVVFDPASMGRAIAHFRQSQAMTQDDLAVQAGLHRPYVSQLERGKATAQTERLFRLLRRLGLEVAIRPRSRD